MDPGDVSPGRWGCLPQVKRPPGGEVCTWWVLDLPGRVQMTSKSQWSVELKVPASPLSTENPHTDLVFSALKKRYCSCCEHACPFSARVYTC